MMIELANKVAGGRVVGNEYVVTRRDEGNRSGIIARFNHREEAQAFIDGAPMPVLKPFRITFKPTARKAAQSWTRFYFTLEAAQAQAPGVVMFEYPKATAIAVVEVAGFFPQ